MINITLPDGSVRNFESVPTVFDVAASIGAGLAKAALAGKVDGALVDFGEEGGARQISPSRTQATSRAGPSATSGGMACRHFSCA